MSPKHWKYATIVVSGLAIVIVVLLVIPLTTTPATAVRPFGFKITSTPETGGVVGIGDDFFCAPSGAKSPVVSLIWTSGGGKLLSEFQIFVLGVDPPPNPDVLIYNVTNASEGGFSFPSAYPYPCGFVIAFEIDAPTDANATVTGFLTYTYTASVPIL